MFQGTTLCRYPWFDQQHTSLFLAFYSPVSNGAQWQRCTKAVAVYFWLSAVEALTLRLTSLLLRLAVLLLELITENPYATVHTQTRSSTSLIRLKDERRKTMQTLSYPITSTATMPNFRQILNVLEEPGGNDTNNATSMLYWMLVESACSIVRYPADECTDLPYGPRCEE